MTTTAATTKLAKRWMAEEADEQRTVTVDEASALPGLLGKMAALHLRTYGVYFCMLDGRRVRFVLA